MGEGRRPPPQRRRRRTARWVVGGLLLLALAIGVVTVPLTVFPETVAAPSESDVVAVLAGGRGERLDTALVLMDRQIGAPGPLLAISNGHAPEWPRANALCGTAGPDYSVVCFEPDSQTTRGEAMAIAGMAETLGADRVAIVTSTYHVTRARLLVERCLPDGVELEVVAAPVRGDLPYKVRASVRELIALTGAVVRGGEC